MFKIIILFIGLFMFANVQAQKNIEVSGLVKTADDKPLEKASIVLYYVGEKDTLKTISNNAGIYTFKNVQPKKLVLIVNYIGFEKTLKEISATKNLSIIEDIILVPKGQLLETVVVESSKLNINEDTISYKIDSTMYRNNDNVEELLKNLSGVEVDREGNVTANGEIITMVKVNGIEFFGGDVKTAIKQLNAEMVDKIQMVDDYGKQFELSGFKNGTPKKILNIVLKEGRDNGIFGSLENALGTNNRYLSGGYINKFIGAKQISFTGDYTNTSNNNNANIPNGLGAIIANNNRNTGYKDGIALAKNIKFIYRDDLSKKVSINSAYNYSNNKSLLTSETFQQNFEKNKDSAISNNQNSISNSITHNHSFLLKLYCQIDSMNWLEFKPTITFNKIEEDYYAGFNYYNKNSISLFSGNNSNQHISTVPNFSGNIYWGHSFRKRGRFLSINIDGSNVHTNAGDDLVNNSLSFDANNNPISLFSRQRILQNNNNYTFDISTRFSEPLSSKVMLSLSYSYKKGYIGNNKLAFNKATSNEILIDSLSNNFENILISNRFGLNCTVTQKKYNYSIGIDIQPSTIESNIYNANNINFKQELVNYFPVAAFSYKFSASKSIRISYDGKTNQPTFRQIQPAPDFSNIQNVVFGNVQLKPSFSNSLNCMFSNYIAKTGDRFFAKASFLFINDKIINNIVRKQDGTQETNFLNANGFYNFSVDYGYTKKIKGNKYTINYTGTANSSNDVNIFNAEKINNNVLNFNQSIGLTVKPNKWIETNERVTFNFYESKNSLNAIFNNKWQTWNFIMNAKLFLKYDFIIQFDVRKQYAIGFRNTDISNPFILNGSFEKQFLKNKKASVGLKVNDLLNQSIGITRNINSFSNAIVESRTNQLQRYFLVNFVYRFSKFKSSK